MRIEAIARFAVFLVVMLAAGSAEARRLTSGIASQYEPWVKGPFVPNARYAGAWSTRPTPSDLVCAHRTLPFGTLIEITNLSHPERPSAVCAVWDRGPWGQCVPAEEGARRDRRCKRGFRYRITTNPRLPRGAYWRGVIDATPAVHVLMDSKGWIWVRFVVVGFVRHVPRSPNS